MISNQEQISANKRLYDLRTQRKMTQQEVAAETGMHTSYISHLEKDGTPIGDKAARILSEFFSVPFTDLYQPKNARAEGKQ